MKKTQTDFTGTYFGNAVALKRVGTYTAKGGQTFPVWLIKCECGGSIYETTSHMFRALRNNHSLICQECNKKRQTKKEKIVIRKEYSCGCVIEGGRYVALSLKCGKVSHTTRAKYHKEEEND